MTNGNTKGGSTRPDAPVEASRADRVMGRTSSSSSAEQTQQPATSTRTATRGSQAKTSQGKTTQSWRPPTARSNGTGATSTGAAASANGSATKGSESSPSSGTTSAPQNAVTRTADPDSDTTKVTTGQAAAAVPSTSKRSSASPVVPGVGSPATRSGSSSEAAKTDSRGSAARSGGTAASASSASQFGAARRTRKARLRLARLDPWSVMKTSFLFSLAALVVLVVATAAIYGVLQTAGLFAAVNEVFALVVTSQNDPNPFNITDILSLNRVVGGALVIGALNVVIFTALATLFAFLYNISATLLGGLEVTLAED